MKVKDLTLKLAKFDPEMEVLVSWDCETPGDINSVEIRQWNDVFDKDSAAGDGYPQKWLEIEGGL